MAICGVNKYDPDGDVRFNRPGSVSNFKAYKKLEKAEKEKAAQLKGAGHVSSIKREYNNPTPSYKTWEAQRDKYRQLYDGTKFC